MDAAVLFGKSFFSFSSASTLFAGSVIFSASFRAFMSGGLSRAGGLASSPAAALGCAVEVAGVWEAGAVVVSWALAPVRTSNRQRAGKVRRAVIGCSFADRLLFYRNERYR